MSIYLKKKISTGTDGICTKLIKTVKNELIKPLTIITNFLNLYKFLKLYHCINQMTKCFYQIIDPLNCCHLYQRFLNICCWNNWQIILLKITYYLHINIVDNLTYKLDFGLIPINIYLDLSKAFDTLPHDILLDKMSYYCVKGVAHDLLRSYLTQRQQIVEFDGFLSKSLEMKTVPQRSVLGSFLSS